MAGFPELVFETIKGFMNIETFPIEGLKLITLKSFADERGFFVERFKHSAFRDLGLPTEFVQDNFSKSIPGTLRALHFQFDQPQGKLVTCLRGKIFDVAVDLRRNSKTFGQHVSTILTGDMPQCFWIPEGFAHGFYAFGDSEADVMYKCTSEYNPKGESGILWSDSALAIQWPIENDKLILSPKDRVLPTFADYKKAPLL
jgi:dTDP-4-dehydrorhamnose 3,5-epimerase